MKKQNSLFVLLMLLCFIWQAGAQSSETDKQTRIGTSLGYSFSGYKEESYSTVNRYLNTLSFILDANIEKRNYLHSFNAGFFMGNSETANPANLVLQEDYDPQIGEGYYWAYLPEFLGIRGYFEYALDYRLWGNNIFPGYLGGAFRADAYLQFANYPSITGIISLNIHASQKWIINQDNSFIFSMGFPVFGYAVRPPYAGADAAFIKYAEESPLKIISLGEITSLHNHWAIFGDLKYHHRVNDLLSLYSGLGFELSRINFHRPRTDAILRLSSGIAFSF